MKKYGELKIYYSGESVPRIKIICAEGEFYVIDGTNNLVVNIIDNNMDFHSEGVIFQNYNYFTFDPILVVSPYTNGEKTRTTTK